MAEFVSHRGRLLVSEPTMADPNFARTVVLMVEHTTEGAAGVILNRPTDLETSQALPEWGPTAAAPSVVFFGGPVAPGAAVCLATSRGEDVPDGWQPVVGRLGVVDLSREAESILPCVDEVRIFSGYSGWGEGQLEFELEQGAWFVLDASPEDVLTPVPQGLWRTVLRRQGGTLAMVAQFPLDVSTN